MSAALASSAPPDPIAEGRAALFGGDPERAAQLFGGASKAQPGDFELRYWFYSALRAADQAEAARFVLEEARTLHAVEVIRAVGADMARFQTDKAYCAQIGLQLYAAKLMGAASVCLGRCLDFENPNAQHILSYGLSLQHQGRMDEAIDVFTAAAELFRHPEIHEFLLYPLFHAPDRLRRLSEEARRWGDLYAAPLTPAKVAFANARTTERRLRIGYVAPSFTRSQLAQFILPVLDTHDPEAVEVFVYCADPRVESGLPPRCKVRSTGGVSDVEVVAQMRLDRIDILVDLWGHTAGSRLPVFAHRAAPIQISWLNFIHTTGLASMDYVLHADCMQIPGTPDLFTEEIWSLGEILSPYRPAPNRPNPVPTPALKNGYVTFGSFINPAKLNEMTIEAWASILKARPADRLVLKYSYFQDPVLQRATQARFAAYRAQPEQLEFRGNSSGEDYLREFQDIDLALDPSPCPGGTTSCDALANGVPVLTQRGRDFYERIGPLLVAPLGLPQLVAEDWDDYIVRAHALTADFAALNELRAQTRAAFDASPCRDEAGFTRKLEGVYREMFARWMAEE
jgi:protein O-GlcNAc transferase